MTETDGDRLAGILIKDAHETVTADRDTHGDAVENMEHIGEAWTWYLRGMGLLEPDEMVTGADAARMMEMVKLSRTAVGTYDVDHDRDVCGYSGIAAACEVYRGTIDAADLTREDR